MTANFIYFVAPASFAATRTEDSTCRPCRWRCHYHFPPGNLCRMMFIKTRTQRGSPSDIHTNSLQGSEQLSRNNSLLSAENRIFLLLCLESSIFAFARWMTPLSFHRPCFMLRLFNSRILYILRSILHHQIPDVLSTAGQLPPDISIPGLHFKHISWNSESCLSGHCNTLFSE